DDDLVGHAHGREAVRDQDDDAVGRERAEVFEDAGLDMAMDRERLRGGLRRNRRQRRFRRRAG
ncbi:hypothetical protein, partial [Dokdonella immobilis]|uniref:hypothetical protein n=1 Tax=Dokdonella immobilis TaxID=578942 RepID=UPI001C31ABE3